MKWKFFVFSANLLFFMLVSQTAFSAVTITSIVPAQPSCFGVCDGIITVNATGATMYSIDGGFSFQSSNVFTGVCAGTYPVMASDGSSFASGSITVTQPGQLVAGVTSDTTICDGQCINITGTSSGGTAPYTFSWSPPSGTGSTINVCPTSTTTYTFSLNDANGCGPVNANVTVTVLPPLSVSTITDTGVCQGDSVLLSAVGSGGTGTYSYVWSNNMDGTLYFGSNIAVAPLDTIIYCVTLDDGCSNYAVSCITVNRYPVPAASYIIDASLGCTPFVVNFVQTIIPTPASCSWDFGDGTTITSMNPSHVFTSPGCYDISLNAVSTYGCLIDTIIYNQICVFASPVLNFSVTNSTTGGSDGAIDMTTTGGTLTYDWSNDGTGDADDTEDITGLAPGMYTIMVMDAITGCMAMDTVFVGTVGINEYENANAFFYPNPFNDKLNFSGDVNHLESVSFLENTGRIITRLGINEITTSMNVTNLPKGHYILKVVYKNGYSFTKQLVKL